MTKTPDDKRTQVVLVEDDDEIAEMVRIVIEEMDAVVHRATDGVTGLDLVRAVRPHAVILDIMMPRMNGYEVCVAIQSDPALSDTRIVVLTGLVEKNGNKTEEEWRCRMGVADFILKPFDVSDFSNRIKNILLPPSDAS